MQATNTCVSDDGDDYMPTYCFDIRNDPNHRVKDFLLTTWNEVPMVEGGVPTANGSAKVGSVNVGVAKVDDGDIPGFPTYFYFIPDQNIVLAIRPEGSRQNGHRGLTRLMRGFIELSSRFVVYAQSEHIDEKQQICGYRDGNEGEIFKLYPSYQSKPRRLKGKIDFLKTNRNRIRKLVRTSTLEQAKQDDRSLAGKLLESAGILDKRFLKSEIKVHYEIDFTPTDADLTTLITSIEAGDADDKSRIGFKMTGEQEVHWLDHAMAKDEIQVDTTPDNQGTLPAAELFSELLKVRVKLIGIANIPKTQNE